MELRKNSKHGPYSALEVAILGAIFGEAKMREFLKLNLIMTRTGWLDPILSSISYLTLLMVNQYSGD